MERGSKRICNSKAKHGEIAEDRLGSLPDFIISHILSRLPIENAVATSALSRGWRHCWTDVTTINFSHFLRNHRRMGHSMFFTIVDDVFRQLRFPDITKFLIAICSESLPGDGGELSEAAKGRYRRGRCSQLESLIGQVCGPVLRTLKICVKCDYEPWIPPSVFRTQSLVTLSLHGGVNCKLPKEITLPNLKQLHVLLGYHHDELFRRLFRSCPILEILVVMIDSGGCIGEEEEDEVVVHISSPKLKILYLSLPTKLAKVMIDAPSLQLLQISNNFSTYCFAKNPTTLGEVRIIERMRGALDIRTSATGLLKLMEATASTRMLHLPAYIVRAVSDLRGGILPMFCNLIRLCMVSYDPGDWKVVLGYLQSLPNLEEIDLHLLGGVVIEGDLRAPDPAPSCLSSHLKRIVVRGIVGNKSELELMKFILSKANVLEQLVVKFSSSVEQKGEEICKELDFCEKLFTFPRGSPTCRIEFHGTHLQVSGKGIKIGNLDSQVVCLTNL